MRPAIRVTRGVVTLLELAGLHDCLKLPGRPALRAATSSPTTANRCTTAIAAKVSQQTRLSSRSVLSRPVPTCSAIVHPLRLRIWLISAAAYLPRPQPRLHPHKHGRSTGPQARQITCRSFP